MSKEEQAQEALPERIKFTICWTKADKEYFDFIRARSISEAQELLDRLKNEGRVNKGWQSGRYFIELLFSEELTVTYPDKETAHAHLDAIKIRGKLHSICINEHKRLAEAYDQVSEALDFNIEEKRKLEAQIAKLKAKAKQKPRRRKAPTKKS